MAGLFQKVWNHTRKDSKSIYGRSSLDAGHRSLHKRPLQYIDEGSFARISSSSPSSLTTTKKQRKSRPETKQFFFSLFPDWRSLSSGRRTRNHSEYMIIKSTGTTPQMCAEEWWNDDNNNNHNHNHLNPNNNHNNVNNNHHHAKSVIAPVDSASMMEKPLPSPLDKPLPSVRTAPDRALVRMKHRMVRHHRRWAGSKQFWKGKRKKKREKGIEKDDYDDDEWTNEWVMMLGTAWGLEVWLSTISRLDYGGGKGKVRSSFSLLCFPRNRENWLTCSIRSHYKQQQSGFACLSACLPAWRQRLMKPMHTPERSPMTTYLPPSYA